MPKVSDEDYALTLIGSSGFMLTSIPMTRALHGDTNSLYILSYLLNLYNYYKSTDSLQPDKSFFNKVDDFEAATGINDYFQRKGIKTLEDYGFLETQNRGSPPVRYIKFKFKAISDAIIANIPMKAPTVSVSEAKKKKATTRVEFYANLNRIFHETTKPIPGLSSCYGNIPNNIGDFMYCWVRLFEHYTHQTWGWGSRSYGYLRNFIVGESQSIDYHRVFDFFNTLTPTGLEDTKILHSFVKWYHGSTENLGEDKWSSEDLFGRVWV